MAGFMVGNQFLLLQLRIASFLLKSHHDTVNSSINFFPSNSGLGLAGSSDGSFIHQVLKLGTRESRSTAGDGFKINIRFKGLATRVNTQDTSAALEVWQVNSHLTIKTSRSEERLIKDINSVSGCNCDDSWVSIKTIHLNQNLIDSLFTFIISTGISSTTLATNSIDLINENNTGSILPGLSKDITDARSTDTHKHFNKFRTTDTDERDTSFSGNSLGQKSFSSTRRSIEDDTPRNTASILCVCLGFLQKVNNLSKFQLGTITSSNIIKGDSSVWNHLDFCLGLSKSHWVSWSTHGTTSTTSTATTQEEQSSKQDSREDEALGEFTKATGFLRRQHGNINLVTGQRRK
mmetsp:Transcript_2465/g.5107  ORF Transcript_2465/g.5107 Transcript_2465/m.5107 type:complete len:348 (+) Transcript_2465:713-1756(+)